MVQRDGARELLCLLGSGTKAGCVGGLLRRASGAGPAWCSRDQLHGAGGPCTRTFVSKSVSPSLAVLLVFLVQSLRIGDQRPLILIRKYRWSSESSIALNFFQVRRQNNLELRSSIARLLLLLRCTERSRMAEENVLGK